MKTTLAVVVLLITAVTAAAQQQAPPAVPPETTPPKIDASPDSLMKLLADHEAPKPSERVDVHFGAIDVRAFGTRFRIGYLPFAMPFVGSRFSITKEWPDAFSVLGTPIAMTPRQFARSRAMTYELRRIEKLEKVKATVKVGGN